MTLSAPEWPRCFRCGKPSAPDFRVKHEGNWYCCDDCAPAGAIELAQSTLRRQVLERDKGICAGEDCGRDCLVLREQLDALKVSALADAPDKPSEARNLYEVKVQALVREGFPESDLRRDRKSLWAADHIEPRVLSGPTTLINARTLCIACHAKATAQLAGDRAASRRPFRRDR